MRTTTEHTYDADLTAALALLTERLPVDGAEPAGEHAQSLSDALNDTWVDGLTLAAWVDAAERRLSGAALVRACVDASGLSARRFAHEVLAGRDERTIRRWLQGEIAVPAQTRAWLEAWLAERG